MTSFPYDCAGEAAFHGTSLVFSLGWGTASTVLASCTQVGFVAPFTGYRVILAKTFLHLYTIVISMIAARDATLSVI
jgi:hypothetical protein